MIETFLTVAQQVGILFILIAAGFFLAHKKVIDDRVRRGLTALLVNLTTPCIIISEMQTERTYERMIGLALTAGVFAAFLLFGILLSKLLTVRVKSKPERASTRMCMTYTNCGFMGFPLLASLSSLVGSDALFFGTVIIGVNNLFMFTHGVYTLGGSKSVKDTLKMIISPAVIGVFIGAALFFAQITLPEVVSKPISYIGSMNTPLAMLTLGAIIYSSDIKTALRDKRIYFPTVVRNLLSPAVFLAVIAIFGIKNTAVLTCFVTATCSVGGMCAILSEQYNGDAPLASRIFSLSTLSSMITIPILISTVLQFVG